MSSESVLTEAEVALRLAEGLGAPVRVTILDAETRERRFRILGVLSGTDPTGLVVDCVEWVSQPISGATAAIEILVDSRLLWCHTQVSTGAGSDRDRLFARLPEKIHVSQRRRYPRVDIEVQVHLVAQSDRRVIPATMRDISAGGASMIAGAALPVGERVSVICALGSGLYLSDVQAETVRCSDQGDSTYYVAVRFVCDPQQEAMIAAWVTDRIGREQQRDDRSA
ncbi:MAG TPA: PilZ domain-containing protein [Symbiobacteriaceae bacterium]|nr:PilZ domain-containing protein [Symbiobacteriaceae bacterium]